MDIRLTAPFAQQSGGRTVSSPSTKYAQKSELPAHLADNFINMGDRSASFRGLTLSNLANQQLARLQDCETDNPSRKRHAININSAYRITSTAASIAELAKNRPGIVVKATDEQIAELKLHDEQVQAREEANRRYAEQHPVKVYGQVVVDGELFATVYESGGAMTSPPMKMSNEGLGTNLAETRLNVTCSPSIVRQ